MQEAYTLSQLAAAAQSQQGLLDKVTKLSAENGKLKEQVADLQAELAAQLVVVRRRLLRLWLLI